MTNTTTNRNKLVENQSQIISSSFSNEKTLLEKSNGQVLTLRVEKELKKDLLEFCEKENINVADFLRYFIKRIIYQDDQTAVKMYEEFLHIKRYVTKNKR